MTRLEDGSAVGEAPAGDPPRPGRVAAALGGVSATLVGLGAGELVAGARRELRSPVVGVGDRVIDHVPAPVKDWAVRELGTSDKDALVAGIVTILVVLGAGVGVLVLRHHRVGAGVAAAGVVAAVGAVAAVASPTQGLGAAWPSVAAGGATALALWALHRCVHPATGRHMPDRRRLVVGVAATSAAALVLRQLGRSARGRFSVAGERADLVLPTADAALAPLPVGLEVDVEGVTPLVTPNGDFYRIDTALTVPTVPVDDWRLRVHGMVDAPLELTFAELIARPLVEADVTLCCVSNEVGGRLVGNARWQGVRLDDLLAEVGVHPDADQVVGRAVDGFTAGFPVAALDGRDALVAVAMNGEPLPVEHGYPARLVVPGLYGYVSATKWLAEIELTRFDEVEGYWVPRGWAREAPVLTQSRIDTPRGRITSGAVAVAGVAWAGVRGVARVEVRVDDGPWEEAALGVELAATTWRQWWWAWEAPPGRHRLTVRATDGTGSTQTEERRGPAPDGATGWHGVDVTVDG